MTTTEEDIAHIRGWLTGRLPTEWFSNGPEVTIDREEITIVGEIDVPSASGDDAAPSDAERAAGEAGRISAFREGTRDARIRIASELEHRTGRKVAWGVRCGGTRQLFTTMSVPVMTRLRQPERQVLDTLVEAGVARSRSDALAWCVKLVGQHSDEWLNDLRTALRSVEEVRGRGPA